MSMYVFMLLEVSFLMVMFFRNVKARVVKGRGWILGGGVKMLCLLSFFILSLEICFFSIVSDLFFSVLFNFRCFVILGSLVGFLGEIVIFLLKEMWLDFVNVC